MITRRLLLALSFIATALPSLAQEIGDDGLHKQPWFHDGFLVLGEDLEEAAADGKGLIVIFEQLGCPYCRELHEVNYAIPEIADVQSANFLTVQINIWGDRIVTDFDGEELSEKKLAQKWGVNFTPTVSFFPAENAGATSFDTAEAFRMPGYFKPFHYATGLEYLTSGGYIDTGFQRFARARFVRMEEEGLNPSLWE